LDPSDSYFLFADFVKSLTVTEKNATKNILDGQKDGRTEVKQYTPLLLRGAGV
jgi:hypothetical protein